MLPPDTVSDVTFHHFLLGLQITNVILRIVLGVVVVLGREAGRCRLIVVFFSILVLQVLDLIIEQIHVDVLVGLFLLGLHHPIHRLKQEQDEVKRVDLQLFEVAPPQVPLMFVALGEAAHGVALLVEGHDGDLLPFVHLLVELVQLVH